MLPHPTPSFGLGCLRSLPDPRDWRFADHPAAAQATLPAAVSLLGEQYPADNQGGEGSCVAFACGRAYRRARRRRHGCPPVSPGAWAPSLHYGRFEDYTPSYQLLYAQARQDDGTWPTDGGTTLRRGIQTLRVHGACAHHNWEYRDSESAVPPPAAAITNAARHETVAYHALDGTGLQFQQALAAGLDVVFGVLLYQSFYTAAATGVVPLPQPAREHLLGGHALYLAGYQTLAGQLTGFAVLNSWGTSFGDHGVLHFPAAYLTDPQLCWDAWALDLGAP